MYDIPSINETSNPNNMLSALYNTPATFQKNFMPYYNNFLMSMAMRNLVPPELLGKGVDYESELQKIIGGYYA